MRYGFFVAGLALLLALWIGSASAASVKKDPLTVRSFTVKIAGLGLEGDGAFFKSVSGIKMETDVVEYREGGVNEQTIHKAPGTGRWGNILLKRPFTGESPSEPIRQWARAVHDGQVIRKDITVTLYHKDLSEAARYVLHNCWPVRWELGTLDDASNDPMDEIFEIATEGIEVVQ